ncbi:hypothetical protein BH09ACT1_BH09ACT1_20660 [soil metagenome]
MGYMNGERSSAQQRISARTDGGLFELMKQFGLATEQEIADACDIALTTDRHPDDILVAKGIIEPALLLRLMASAWLLPSIDLSKDRAERELITEWSDADYLRENWIPVRDKANGALLVATARRPDAERTARIVEFVECPVEFAVATSYDIRLTVERHARGKRILSFIR